MILELLINIFLGLATFIINLIPEIELGSNFFLAFNDVAVVMTGASYILPFGTFIACLSVYFLLNNIQFIVSIFNWLIRKIPGVN